MTSARLNTLPVSEHFVSLPTGRVIRLADVAFDGREFFYGGLNVSAYLTARQRNSFPGYDPTEDNRRASDAAREARGQAPVAEGSTSVLKNFVDGVASDLDLSGSGVGGKVGTAIAWAVGLVIVGGFAWWAFNRKKR